MRKKILLIPILTALATSAAADELVYLNCQTDPEFGGKPNFILNKTSKLVSLVPTNLWDSYEENDLYYISRQEVGGLFSEFKLNKYDLRFSVYTSLMPKPATGQCKIEDKKI